jgi:hypothetical protein
VAYGSVFALEALLFIASAMLAFRIPMTAHQRAQSTGIGQPSFS